MSSVPDVDGRLATMLCPDQDRQIVWPRRLANADCTGQWLTADAYESVYSANAAHSSCLQPN